MLDFDRLTKKKKLREENARKMNFNLDDAKWWRTVVPICLDCPGFDDCPVPIKEKCRKASREAELYDKYHKETKKND